MPIDSATILERLGLSTTTPNAGLYNGKWGGSGEVYTSVNPASTFHRTHISLMFTELSLTFRNRSASPHLTSHVFFRSFPLLLLTAGETLAQIAQATVAETNEAIAAARKAYLAWRNTPAPARGDIIREIRAGLAGTLHTLTSLAPFHFQPPPFTPPPCSRPGFVVHPRSALTRSIPSCSQPQRPWSSDLARDGKDPHRGSW